VSRRTGLLVGWGTLACSVVLGAEALRQVNPSAAGWALFSFTTATIGIRLHRRP
jgi:hypothetical protein